MRRAIDAERTARHDADAGCCYVLGKRMRSIHAVLTRRARSHDRDRRTFAKLALHVELMCDFERSEPMRVPRNSRPNDAQRSGHKGNAISYQGPPRQVRAIQHKRFQPLAGSPYIYIPAECGVTGKHAACRVRAAARSAA
jgi:hypothetical protein